LSISQAMWVHGHSIQPENPALTVGRIGWAGQIRTLDSAGWYHIAIPTTVIVTDIRQRIDSAMVEFATGTQGFLRAFHVYDGQTRIAFQDNLNVTGAGVFYRFTLSSPARPFVGLGIGISLNLALGHDPQQAWIDIHAAGVDFV
jgi:Family of unknown function (DUF6623)